MPAIVTLPDEQLWSIRAWIYRLLAERGRPPSVAECAQAWKLAPAAAREAYRALEARHALLLAPDGESIRMAHPFSGVPTSFVVRSGGIEYWANCAWDALGIPAALHADAEVDAFADGGAVHLAVRNGQLHSNGELVHFALPFRRWYDDLVFT